MQTMGPALVLMLEDLRPLEYREEQTAKEWGDNARGCGKLVRVSGGSSRRYTSQHVKCSEEQSECGLVFRDQRE